jgi:hypothetical protein
MTNPMDKETVVEKINNADVKVKGAQKPKANTQKPKPKTEQLQNPLSNMTSWNSPKRKFSTRSNP